MLENSPDNTDDMRADLLNAEGVAFSRFNELLDRSIEGIGTKVEELKSKHPRAYDVCLGLLSREFAKDAHDIKGTLADYLRVLAHAYHNAPVVIDRISRDASAPELDFVKITDASLISCSLKLDDGGEYRMTLSFKAPPSPPGGKSGEREGVFQTRNGHFFFRAESAVGPILESLGALDDAVPFRSNAQLDDMAERVAVERAYVIAFTDFIGFTPNPDGGPALRYREYHFVELPGADLGAKLEGAERFLGCSNPRSSSAARKALPEGYRSGMVACVGVTGPSGVRNPPFADIIEVVRGGAPGEWTVLQSKKHPTFNEADAYVLVRRREELVVSPDAPKLLIASHGVPTLVSGAMCGSKDGGYEPLRDLGSLVQDATVPPTFDRDAWARREAADLRSPD